jgi:hypothetical protein
MKLQYTLTKAEFTRNLKISWSAYGAPSLGAFGHAVNLVTWVCVSLAGLSAWDILRLGGMSSTRPMVVVVCIVFAAAGHALYLKISSARKLDWYVERNGPFPAETVTLLNEGGLSTESDGFRVDIPNKDIQGVRVLENDVLVSLRRFGALVIPKAAFVSGDELRVFCEAVALRVRS